MSTARGSNASVFTLATPQIVAHVPKNPLIHGLAKATLVQTCTDSGGVEASVLTMTTSDDGDWFANASTEPEWAAAIGTPDSSPSSTSLPMGASNPTSLGANAGPQISGASSELPTPKTPFGDPLNSALPATNDGALTTNHANGANGANGPGATGKTEPTKAKGKRSKSDADRSSNALTNGVAADPTTTPSPQLSRRQRKAAEKARAKRRPKPKMRLLPRSVLGMSMLILAAGIGAAVSGTGLYMNYAYRRDVSDAQVKGLRTTISKGVEAVNAEGTNARFRIQQELEPLLRQAAIGDTLAQILRDAQPSLWSIRTFDEGGQATVGTAFVVASDAEKSFLLTSLSVVRASIVRPGPEILLQQDKTQATATLWSWQEDKDIALLIVQKGNLPKIQWAKSDSTKVGTQVFAVSGFGTAGGAVTNGFIADVSTSGVQHSSALGTAFRGGPLLDGTGKVVAVLSKSYAPFGFASDGVWFAPPVTAACDKVLKCPNGQVTGAGPEQPSAAAPVTKPVPTAIPTAPTTPKTTIAQ
jgi:Trypsin-like peptidase domain